MNLWSVTSPHCKWQRRQLLKMARFPTFKGSWPWIGSYCILSCITHWPLPTCQISLKLKEKTSCGRMYIGTDGHLRPEFQKESRDKVNQKGKKRKSVLNDRVEYYQSKGPHNAAMWKVLKSYGEKRNKQHRVFTSWNRHVDGIIGWQCEFTLITLKVVHTINAMDIYI